MPKPAKGELTWTAEGPVARITLKGRERESYLLSACHKPGDAEQRRSILAGIAQRFRRAGVIDTRHARELLKTIAGAAPALLPAALQVAGELAGGTALPGEKSKAPTFSELGKEWTSGKLHKRFRDHVKAKDSTLDAARLGKLYELDVGGMRLGDIAVDEFTLDHAEAAMGQLPEEAKRPGTRRGYAQLLNRVMALAVYPCRYIAASPLPRGFMPKVGKPPAYPYLYPAEDAALMACGAVPLCRRILFGFLAREGCRVSEAAGLRFADLDLKRGVITLDENKTDDARSWALDPGVTAALAAYKKLREAEDTDRVFVDDEGRTIEGADSLAPVLREDLNTAGVARPELFKSGKNRQPLRVHDLRASFITIGLANGRTESWIADRTGHSSSQMINRYRRASRGASELGLGELSPLNAALPELADYPGITQNAQPLGSDRSQMKQKNRGGSTGTRTQDQRIKKTSPIGADQDPSGNAAGATDEESRGETPAGQSVGNQEPVDVVEAALADALRRAAEAGAFDAVAALTVELRARREARAAVVSLDAERARRNGKT
jgi:integrase